MGQNIVITLTKSVKNRAPCHFDGVGNPTALLEMYNYCGARKHVDVNHHSLPDYTALQHVKKSNKAS